jgi:hypothetical protein
MIITLLNYRKLQLKYVGWPANFDNISVVPNGQYKTYFNDGVGVFGPWNFHGAVFLIPSSGSEVELGRSSPYPYGLIYGCLLETHDRATETYIERTFNNVVPGTSFYVSFWITLRYDSGAYSYVESQKPSSTFKVYLNSEMVYSGPPTSYVWELMNTTTFITNGTNLTLRFEVTSMDTETRNMGINGIIIHPSATAQGPTSSSQGSIQPSTQPSSQPSTQPSMQPLSQPSSQPSSRPTIKTQSKFKIYYLIESISKAS